jgi:hypothetical protein
MGRWRDLAKQWWPIGVVMILGVMAALDMVGRLDPIVENLTARTPDFWSASAAWVAVAVGIATVVVAGRYAKQQVEKAQEQVREAQSARLDQERQAQEAIETQVRIAEEQAQPNVVLYTELNPSVKQFIEVVVKNFGTTPAYNVKALIGPPLKATPNLLSAGKLADVVIPEFPILAPGQEWRTGWDHTVARKRHNKEWQPLAGKAESELTGDQKFQVQAYLSTISDDRTIEQAITDMTLPSKHTATVVYQNRQGKKFATTAVLDPEVFKGTTWVDIKTVHDLTKMLEKKLAEQNKLSDAIHRRLAEFGTEHEGIWVYGGNDAEERDLRESVSAATDWESRHAHDHLIDQLSGQRPRERPVQNASEPIAIRIDDARMGDFYVPIINEQPSVAQSWMIAFSRRYDHPRIGVVYELFKPNGDMNAAICEREGAQIYVVRGEI